MEDSRKTPETSVGFLSISQKDKDNWENILLTFFLKVNISHKLKNLRMFYINGKKLFSIVTVAGSESVYCVPFFINYLSVTRNLTATIVHEIFNFITI